MGENQGFEAVVPYRYVTRRQRFKIPAETARSRFGVSPRYATESQKAARSTQNYWGRGRYRRRYRRKYRRYGRRRYRRRYRGRGIYTGTGGFWGDAWNWAKKKSPLRSALMDVAQTGASFIPGIGGALSSGIGTGRRAFGLGAYQTNTNDLIQSGGNTFKAPSFGGTSDTGAVMLQNREYIGNIYAPGTSQFSIQTYDLNPGMPETFSWLSQIAANYDNYEFGQLMFTFKSTVSDFQTSNGVVGQVIMTTQYNSSLPIFRDKQSMMTYHGAVAGKTSQNSLAGVECDPKKIAGAAIKYVRYQNLMQGQDYKDYDLGRMEIAVVDCPETLFNQAIGELWVSYTVKLSVPKLVVGRGLAIQQDLWAIGQPAAGAVNVRIAPRNLAGQVSVLWASNTQQQMVFVAPQNNIKCLVEAGPNGGGDIPAPGPPPGQPVGPVEQDPDSGFKIIANTGISNVTPALNVMGTLKITFPAQYSGDVCITYQATSTPANGLEAGQYKCWTDGNVDSISDMLMGLEEDHGAPLLNSSTCFDCGTNPAQYSAGGGPLGITLVPSVRLKVHVRVSQAIEGFDNIVYLGFQGWAGSGADGYIQNALLTIEEYNSGFASEGTQQDLIPWENVVTGAPLTQP
ncbi:MAG TPA: hypothetical protein EYN66_01870 [Myxococcales bacterium]|nr:hypothetical protein [Myxococcales bacterium]